MAALVSKAAPAGGARPAAWAAGVLVLALLLLWAGAVSAQVAKPAASAAMPEPSAEAKRPVRDPALYARDPQRASAFGKRRV